MQTAAAYIRVSTDEQTEFSPDSQLKAILNYAKSHDMILPEEFIFVDEGISGRTAIKRPQFNRMIATAKIKPKPFDVILLWKFSRFARNRQDSIVYKSMLRRQCGIDVVSVSEQIGDDNTSVLIEALIEAMDEYYSLNLAEEVKRGMHEKFSRGGVVSQPPFGYRMGEGIFVPDEINAPIVKMIYNDYLSGMGARKIAEKLNDMGAKSTKGNNFENRTVEYILTNPVYIGKMRRSRNGRDNLDRFHENPENTEYVYGRHEPLISDDTFERVQKKRAEVKKLYTKYQRQAPAEFMLKGLVRCSNCGATLTLSSKNQMLQCHNYAKGACKISHGITLNKINPVILNRLESDYETGNFDVSVIEPETIKQEKSSVSLMLEKERKKLIRVREAYAAGIDTLEEYKENKAKIQSRISELESIEPKTEDPQDLKDKFFAKFKATLDIVKNPDASETAKNTALRAIIDKIVFIKPQNIVEIFYKM